MGQVYFAGTEPHCFGGTFSVSTSGAYHDPNYSRCALAATKWESIVATLPDVALPSSPGGVWIHALQHTYDQQDHGPWITVQDQDGNYVMRTSYSDYSITEVTLYGAAGGAVASLSMKVEDGLSPVPNDTFMTVDLHFYDDAEGNGTLDLYGATRLLSRTQLVGERARDIKTVTFASPNDHAPAFFSEVIVANFDTRWLRVGTYVPSGAGTYADGTGDYTAVDEIEADASLVELATAGDQHSFALSLHGAPAEPGVVAIAVNGVVGAGVGNDAQFGIRVGGVDYFSPNLGVDVGLTKRGHVWSGELAAGVPVPVDLSSAELIVKAV